VTSPRPDGAVLTAVGMLLYALLVYGSMRPDVGTWVAVLTAPVVYLLVMYLYYGIARLALLRRQAWLWTPAVIGIAISFLLVGSSRLWLILTGWAIVLFASLLTGRLTDRGVRPRTVYTVALGVLLACGIAQYMPMWLELKKMMPELINNVMTDMRNSFESFGASAEQTRLMTEMFHRLATVFYRLMPAESLLGLAAQFSVGYLLFARWVDRTHAARPQLEPFIYWKMPYGYTAVVIVLAIMRLVGGETGAFAADNGLAIIAVFYTVTGLALIEYYLRKIQFSRLMKVLFYVFLFLLPLVNLTMGLVIGAVIFLLGFADSFADWRRVHLREYA